MPLWAQLSPRLVLGNIQTSFLPLEFVMKRTDAKHQCASFLSILCRVLGLKYCTLRLLYWIKYHFLILHVSQVYHEFGHPYSYFHSLCACHVFGFCSWQRNCELSFVVSRNQSSTHHEHKDCLSHQHCNIQSPPWIIIH